MAKMWGGDKQVEIVDRSLQIFGGYGRGEEAGHRQRASPAADAAIDAAMRGLARSG